MIDFTKSDASDLAQAPEPPREVEFWVNVYEGGAGGLVNPTRAIADAACGRVARFACLHVKTTVARGEGLSGIGTSREKL